jgi:hypothetical protein
MGAGRGCGSAAVRFPPVRGACNAGAQTVAFLIMAVILAGVTGPLFNALGADNSGYSGDWLAVTLYVGWAILTLLVLLSVLRLWFAPERVTVGTASSPTPRVFSVRLGRCPLPRLPPSMPFRAGPSLARSESGDRTGAGSRLVTEFARGATLSGWRFRLAELLGSNPRHHS